VPIDRIHALFQRSRCCGCPRIDWRRRKARLVKAPGQVLRVAAEIVERQEGLERRHRSAVEELGEIMNGPVLGQHQLLPGAELLASRNACQGNVARAEQLLLAARVVDGLHIAALLDRPLDLRRAVSNAMMSRARAAASLAPPRVSICAM